MKEQNLEKIFSEGLNNLEGDVSANSWIKIQNGLQAPAQEVVFRVHSS